MMTRHLITFFLLALAMTATAGQATQINTQWQSLQPADNNSSTSSRPLLRDPFSDPQISYGNGQDSAFSQNAGGFGAGFQRGRGDFKVPELVFRGYIESDEASAPMALIQIGKSKVHMVREGDEINIDPTRPRNAIRITKINRLSITVETGILGTMRILR